MIEAVVLIKVKFGMFLKVEMSRSNGLRTQDLGCVSEVNVEVVCVGEVKTRRENRRQLWLSREPYTSQYSW